MQVDTIQTEWLSVREKETPISCCNLAVVASARLDRAYPWIREKLISFQCHLAYPSTT